jgi:hypothetical protein
MAEKQVELTLVFKEVTLDSTSTDDQKFAATLQEALDAVKVRLQDARAKFGATKDAVVVGVPTLEEKGVEIGIKITF